jgi:membrane protease YdiL (CAAX protease family)
VLRAAIIALLWATATSIAIYIPPELNLRLDPHLVWFPLPTLVVAVLVLIKVRKNVVSSSHVAQRQNTHLWIAICTLIVAISALGLFLNGWDRMHHGSVTLRGDVKAAPELFRTIFSVVVVLAAGLVEEASIRGLFQLRVTPIVGDAVAQVGALITFLAFHGAAVTEFRQLVFLAVLGAISGRLTSITRSVVAPAIFHAAVNVLIVCIVLILRPG